MIKITQITLTAPYKLRLNFSDGSWGEMDFAPMLLGDGSLLVPLRDPDYFARCFLELGALCWPNGLEFSAESLRRKLQDQHALHSQGQAAA